MDEEDEEQSSRQLMFFGTLTNVNKTTNVSLIFSLLPTLDLFIACGFSRSLTAGSLQRLCEL